MILGPCRAGRCFQAWEADLQHLQMRFPLFGTDSLQMIRVTQEARRFRQTGRLFISDAWNYTIRLRARDRRRGARRASCSAR